MPRVSLTKQRENAREIYPRLCAKYPDAAIELKFSNPLELAVATILSAQCTDVLVNKATVGLFLKYRKPEDYLAVSEEEFQRDIASIGLFRRKTKSIQALMRAIIEDHGGDVPRDMETLSSLSGIGRKTANVILGNAFGIAAGIVVDTHVHRITQRLGLAKSDYPEKIEEQLMKLFPEQDWIQLSHVFIFHGRRTCKARKPNCDDCPVTELCNHFRKQRGRP